MTTERDLWIKSKVKYILFSFALKPNHDLSSLFQRAVLPSDWDLHDSVTMYTEANHVDSFIVKGDKYMQVI